MNDMTNDQLDLFVLNMTFNKPDDVVTHKSLFMSKKSHWEYLLTIVDGKITWYAADNHKDAMEDGDIMCIQDNYIEYLDCYNDCDERIDTRDNMDFVNQFNNKD